MYENHQFSHLFRKGKSNYLRGMYGKSLKYYKQAEVIVRKCNLIKDLCITIINQAGAYFRLNQYNHAEINYFRALESVKQNGFVKQECEIYIFLNMFYILFNEYTKAKMFLDKASELVINLNEDTIKAKFLNSKGFYSHIFGNHAEALKYYRKAMEYYKKTNDHRGIGSTSNLIAGHYFQINEFTKSVPFYKKAEEIGGELPDFEMNALAICRMGIIHCKIKDEKLVSKSFSKLQDLEEKSENKSVLARICYVKAIIEKFWGNKEHVQENFKKAIDLTEEIENKFLKAKYLKELGIFLLEERDLKISYHYLKESAEIFIDINDKIEIIDLKEQFESYFQDVLDLIWSLSKIVSTLEKTEDLLEMNEIESVVSMLCKINNKNSPDYVMKLQSKLITQSVYKQFTLLKSEKEDLKKNYEKDREDLYHEIEKLRKKNVLLKEKLKNFELKFEEIKKNPETYNGLDESALKDFINTEMWADSKDQLINKYLSDYFNNLDENSKNDLIFIKVVLSVMDTGYETCAFLLTKVVERELRRIIFKSFKSYWKSNLDEFDFTIQYNNKKNFEYNELKTNEVFVNYLNDKYPLTLGNISYILREVKKYCESRNKKKFWLGWEKHFLIAFKNSICRSIKNVYNGLNSEIHTNRDSIEFISLRNLVSHANDIEPEINTYKEIDFDEDFIKNLLEFLTIRYPRLLKEICEIELKFLNQS